MTNTWVVGKINRLYLFGVCLQGSREAVIWLAVYHKQKKALELFSREIAAAGTGMGTSRPPVWHMWLGMSPCLMHMKMQYSLSHTHMWSVCVVPLFWPSLTNTLVLHLSSWPDWAGGWTTSSVSSVLLKKCVLVQWICHVKNTDIFSRSPVLKLFLFFHPKSELKVGGLQMRKSIPFKSEMLWSQDTLSKCWNGESSFWCCYPEGVSPVDGVGIIYRRRTAWLHVLLIVMSLQVDIHLDGKLVESLTEAGPDAPVWEAPSTWVDDELAGKWVNSNVRFSLSLSS